MRIAGLALGLLLSLLAPRIAVAAEPLPDCTQLAAVDLPAAYESWALRGRLHETGAATCLQSLRDYEAGDAASVAANDLRQARQLASIGDRAQALTLARAAYARIEADNPLRAEADTVLGELLLQDEALNEAATHLRAALDAATPADADPWRSLRAQLALARVLAHRRESGACSAQAQTALELARSRYDENHTTVALGLLAVATCQRLLGEHGSAITTLRRGLAIEQPKAGLGNSSLVAQMLVMLAQTLKIAGDFTGAERGYLHALDYLHAHPEPVPVQLSAALHGLANLERDDGRAQLSLTRYTEAIALFEQLYGGQSMRLSHLLNNYANALGMVGRYDEAVATYEQALAIAQPRAGDSDPASLMPIANIALVRLWQQRYAEAETGFRRGIELATGQAAGSESSTLFARLGLAASLWGQGRHGAGFSEAERAEQERQLAVTVALAGMSEAGAMRFQEHLRPGLDLAIAIAYDSGDAALIARAWALTMTARGQVTTETAARLAFARASTTPALRTLFQDWQTANARLANLRLTPPPDRDTVHAAEEALTAAEQALAAAMPGTGTQLRQAPIDPVTLIAGLNTAKTRLIGFTSSGLRAAHDYSHPDSATRARDVYAFVGQQGQPPMLRRLAGEDVISAAVQRWREAVGDAATPLQRLRREGQRLRRWVFDPLAVPTDSRLLIVPYGDLHQVNLAALPDGDGYLLERGLEVHTLNHERELLRGDTATNATLRVLAVSDPAYGQGRAAGTGEPSGGGGCAQHDWPALPGSRREVAALTGLLPASAQVTALSGVDANKDKVLAALPGQNIIHLATHALRRDSDCGNDGADGATARGTRLSVRDQSDTQPENGGVGVLVLSAGGSVGDRYLSEADIAGLALQHARWVVLSACATGLADSRAYEGAFGLRRAFHLAGARTVIMSLWRVDDEATADWMAALYAARLRDGVDTPSALHAAQRAMLTTRRAAGLSDHPYFWAAFIAAGDWR